MRKKDQRRGRLAGRAWADNGRSINAVEAVFKYYQQPQEHERWMAMTNVIGDDDEFNDMVNKSAAYIGAWYRGVVEIANERRTK
jgi:hypothetical protein